MSQLVCVITMPVLVSHHKPLHTLAVLLRWETSSKPLQQWTKADHQSGRTWETDYRSIMTEEQHVQRKVTRQSHLTQLFFVSEPLQERTARMMRKSPSSSEKGVTSSASEEATSIPPEAEATQISQNSWLHHSLVTDGALSPCSRHCNAFASAAVGLFRWLAHKFNLNWALVWISLWCFVSRLSSPLSLASFMAQSTFVFLFSPDVLLFTSWCRSLSWWYMASHSDPSRRLPSVVSNIRGCRSPTFTASWLSTEMNFLSPSKKLLRHFFNKPVTVFPTGLSPSFCWFVKSFKRID